MPKLYCIASEGHERVVSCLILSNGYWYPKYIDHYMTPKYKQLIIERFDHAMKAKGYARIGFNDIPEQYKAARKVQ